MTSAFKVFQRHNPDFVIIASYPDFIHHHCDIECWCCADDGTMYTNILYNDNGTIKAVSIYSGWSSGFRSQVEEFKSFDELKIKSMEWPDFYKNAGFDIYDHQEYEKFKEIAEHYIELAEWSMKESGSTEHKSEDEYFGKIN